MQVQQPVAYVPYDPTKIMQPVMQPMMQPVQQIQPVLLQAAAPPAANSEAKTARQLIEDHNLETPAQSKAFAKYYKDHAVKVKSAKSCLNLVSCSLLIISVVALAFIFMSFMEPKSTSVHRLKSGNGPEGNSEMETIFATMSALIWSSVAVKAK